MWDRLSLKTISRYCPFKEERYRKREERDEQRLRD
jgi:hypothetical protein